MCQSRARFEFRVDVFRRAPLCALCFSVIDWSDLWGDHNPVKMRRVTRSRPCTICMLTGATHRLWGGPSPRLGSIEIEDVTGRRIYLCDQCYAVAEHEAGNPANTSAPVVSEPVSSNSEPDRLIIPLDDSRLFTMYEFDSPESAELYVALEQAKADSEYAKARLEEAQGKADAAYRDLEECFGHDPDALESLRAWEAGEGR